MKIKFLSDRVVEAQGEVVMRFSAGEVYELSESSARRWIKRNVATEVIGKVAKSAPKPKTTKTVASAKNVAGGDGGAGGERTKPDATTTADVQGKAANDSSK